MQVDMLEAKTRLSELVAAAERGDEVVIARAGEPAVRLAPVATRHRPVPRRLGGGDRRRRRLRRPVARLRAVRRVSSGLLDDTHIALWALGSPERLTGRERELLVDPAFAAYGISVAPR